MNGKRITLHVDGMTCGACESRIENALKAKAGVISVRAGARGGRVTVEYDEDLISLGEIKAAIEKTGYPIRGAGRSGFAVPLVIAGLLIAAYFAADAIGAFSAVPLIDANAGYAMLFLIGVLTSVHCVAMCGGIALSQSLSPRSAGPSGDGSLLIRLAPGFLYNAGRVASYTAIGALVGALGAAFDFSAAAKGAVSAAAGIFMLVYGLRMLGVIESLPRLSFLVPVPIRNACAGLDSRLRKGGPLAVGILNGFMPCGPLQTMQFYALGTGSAAAGAFSMFVFSLGTVPLMLSFGVSASLIPRKLMPVMVKTGAFLVLFLGGTALVRAAAIAGVPLPASSSYVQPTFALAGIGDGASAVVNGGAPGAANIGLVRSVLADGKQTVLTEFSGGRYVPFAVQAGVPLVWTIRISAADLNGCNNEVVVPEYGVRKRLQPGDNIVEFTPQQPGRISYSCWMGMIRSSITAVESLGDISPIPDISGGGLALPAGGGCCAVR